MFLALWPLPTIITLMAVATIVYLSTVAHRVFVTHRSLQATNVVTVSDARARAVPDAELPVYTVLVPAYREPEVMQPAARKPRARSSTRADKLDVKLLLEADDDETIAAAARDAAGDRGIELVLVPPAEPRTKPKALNYGLTCPRGELVDHLRRRGPTRPAAAAPGRRRVSHGCRAGRRLPPGPARRIDNADQNLITRWFTIEYSMWFTLFLPGLVSTRGADPARRNVEPLPPRPCSRRSAAWDPYNVTEDADLGIRLHRRAGHGRRARVGDARGGQQRLRQLGEATLTLVQGLPRRRGWCTSAIPCELCRDARARAASLQFNLFVGGTPLLAMLNPLFWFLTVVWFVAHAGIVAELFPAPRVLPGPVLLGSSATSWSCTT